MFLQELPAFLLSYNGLPSPPFQPSHPRAGLGFKWQTGLPSRQDPSLPNKGQNLEEESQEVEDNMFLGIHPHTTLKLTQSPIQNLAFRSSWMTKDFHTANKLLTGHMWFSDTHMPAINAGKKTPTQSQIPIQPRSKSCRVIPEFHNYCFYIKSAKK